MKHANLKELLMDWDRAGFAAFCRRLEVLLLRRRIDQAILALRQFDAWTRREPPSLDASVFDVLPLRIANLCESHGCETLHAAEVAADTFLLNVALCGPQIIEIIKATATAARTGQTINVQFQTPTGDPPPEWEIDWDYLANCHEAHLP